jgi:hypothetical protein
VFYATLQACEHDASNTSANAPPSPLKLSSMFFAFYTSLRTLPSELCGIAGLYELGEPIKRFNTGVQLRSVESGRLRRQRVQFTV